MYVRHFITLFSGLGRHPSGIHAAQHGLFRFLFASGGWLRSALGFGLGIIHHLQSITHFALCFLELTSGVVRMWRMT